MIMNQVVSGGGSAPAGLYREYQLDSDGGLRPNKTTTRVMDFTGVKWVAECGLAQAYYRNTAITGTINMGDITNSSLYSFYSMFEGCTGITGVILSSLANASGVNGCCTMFRDCVGLMSVDISSLNTVSGSSCCEYMFSRCAGLTNIDLSSLTTISGYNGCRLMFESCTGLTSMDFPSLTTINASSACEKMFYGCTGLTRLSFYALNTNSFGGITSQFNNMLQNVTGCTVHFPMRIQSTIGSWTSVMGGFGGTNTTVLFDIVTTLTGADSNAYARSQKDSTSTAIAWTYNDTLYYTNGTSEPSVGDTIYSDDACTTAVTTISSIA